MRVLVTGGNRGIGLQAVKELASEGHDVFLGSRDPSNGEEARSEVEEGRARVSVVQLDVADEASIDACLNELGERGVDVLINNAGIYPSGTTLEADPEDFRRCLEVHLHGPLRLTQGLVPGMVERGHGRVVNVSSGAGSFGEGMSSRAAYAVSKAALNALTVRTAADVPDSVKVNAVCPGWVRTRMGGSNANRNVEKGAAGVVWAATLPDDGPTGGFVRDGERIPW